MGFNGIVGTRDAAKLRERRLRTQGYDDGRAGRAARSALLVYQRSYALGVVARTRDERGDAA